jgi:phytoene dehydrogenase-like protein
MRALGASVAAVAPTYSISVAAGDDRTLALPVDTARAAEVVARVSARDAASWAAFASRVRRVSAFLEQLYQLPAPDVGTTSLGEIMPLLGVGRKLRGLGRDGMMELLRILPMSVSDFVEDEFESDLLRAAVGAGGVRDLRQGPRSGGTVFNLLHYLCGAPHGSVRARSWWRDGPGAFDDTVAGVARDAGAVIRLSAGVARIVIRDDVVTGVVLDDGEELGAPAVLSTHDPAHTMVRLVDPVWLDPEFLHAVGNIKFRGCTAFVQFAVDRLPALTGLDGVVSLTGDLTSLERAYDAAKYGQVSEHAHVEVTAPTLRWPSMAPDGKHALIARVQYAPYARHDGATWNPDTERALADGAMRAIERAAPGFTSTVIHRAITTPATLEREYGLTEGAVSQGEMTLDQVLFMRPVAGWSRHAMPVPGLYLAGSGTHPGPGVTGGAGWLAAREALARGAQRGRVSA